MAALVGGTQVRVKATGSTCSVPENDIGRLMYYIDCICTLLQSRELADLSRLRDFRNWYKLSSSEDDAVVALADALSPSILEDKIIFESAELCGDSGNEFYEISAVRSRLLVADSIVIGGRSQSVNKIMSYKRGWLMRNYYEPLRREKQRRRPVSVQRRRKNDDDCVIL